MKNRYVVNSTDKDWTSQRFVLWFGAYGTTRLLVWGNSLEDALDACVDWLEDNAPGLLVSHEELEELYKEARAEGLDEDRAWERATVDLTCAGNHSRHIPSWEWGILFDNPTREQLKSL